MVVIRLSRGGKKKHPFYHVIVADQRFPRDGRFIARIGYYNPIASEKEIELQIDYKRAQYWLSCGAQPSKTVQSLLKKARHLSLPTLLSQSNTAIEKK